MSNTLHIVIVFAVSAVAAIALAIAGGRNNKRTMIALKSLALFYVLVTLWRSCMSDGFLFVINGGYYENVFYDVTDPLQSILRWGLYISATVSVVAVFCDNKTFKNISICFCLPFALVSTFFYGDFIAYFMQPGTVLWYGFIMPEIVRHIQFSLELILAIVLPLSLLLAERYVPFREREQVKNFFIVLPVTILTLIPMYVPQSLWGYTSITLSGFSEESIMVIGVAFIACFALYAAVRFKSYAVRYSVCFYVALASMQLYTQMYMLGHTVSRIPLQLCDLASYLFFICILFRIKSLFNFNIFANTLGAMIALCEPDTASAVFAAWDFHFSMQHIWVLVVPITFLTLRMFPRPDKKALRDCLIYFTVYFSVCAVTGTIINGFYPETGIRVNYFYLFNDRVLEVLPFMSWTKDWRILIGGRFEIYPIYLFLFFWVYYAACVGVYYLIKKLYKIADEHFMLRRVRIQEKEERTGIKSNKKLFYDDEGIENA